jgi:hypothetical protein
MLHVALWSRMPWPQLPLGGEPRVAAALGRRLWRLHSASCRLLHWLAADSSRRLAAFSAMGAAEWELLPCALDYQFWIVHSLLCQEEGVSLGREERRWVWVGQAVCV